MDAKKKTGLGMIKSADGIPAWMQKLLSPMDAKKKTGLGMRKSADGLPAWMQKLLSRSTGAEVSLRMMYFNI